MGSGPLACRQNPTLGVALRRKPEFSPPAAQKFNIVSKPNNWSRSVAQAARAIDDIELSNTRRAQLAYWNAFQLVLAARRGPLSGNRKPQPAHWMGYPIGRSGFSLSAVMLRPRKQVRAELYISNPDAKICFSLLKRQREAIEGEAGYQLVWEELPQRRDSRIAVYLPDADPEDQSDWDRQHQWLAARLNDLHRLFGSRVKLLDAKDWRPDPDATSCSGG